MREKGATDFDKLCHKVFDANWKNYRARDFGVRCGGGHELEVYYCESQLYLVECISRALAQMEANWRYPNENPKNDL